MHLVLLENIKKVGHRFIADRLLSFLARYMSVTNTQCQKILSLALNTFLVNIPDMFTRTKKKKSIKENTETINFAINW